MDEKKTKTVHVNELTPEEEIEIAEIENYIIKEHDDELDAIALLEETATEHNNAFEKLKAHAKKSIKKEKLRVTESKNMNGSCKDIIHDEHNSNDYFDYYAK